MTASQDDEEEEFNAFKANPFRVIWSILLMSKHAPDSTAVERRDFPRSPNYEKRKGKILQKFFALRFLLLWSID